MNTPATIPPREIVRRARAYERDPHRSERHYRGLSQPQLELFWEAVNTIRGFWRDQRGAAA